MKLYMYSKGCRHLIDGDIVAILIPRQVSSGHGERRGMLVLFPDVFAESEFANYVMWVPCSRSQTPVFKVYE